jgi:hypothetical protein
MSRLASHQREEEKEEKEKHKKSSYRRRHPLVSDLDAADVLQEFFRRQDESIVGPGDPIIAMLSELQARLDVSHEFRAPPDLSDRLAQGLIDLGDQQQQQQQQLTSEQVIERLAQHEVDLEETQEPDEVTFSPALNQTRLKKQVARVSEHLVRNRRHILTKIVLGAIGVAGVYGLVSALTAAGATLGLFSLGSTVAATAAATTTSAGTLTATVAAAAASSSAAAGGGAAAAAAAGLPAWLHVMYAALRTAGWDKAMLKRVSLAIQHNDSVRAWGKTQIVPERARLLLRQRGVPAAYLDASIASLVECVISEGLSLGSAGNLASYLMMTGASTAVSNTMNAASQVSVAAIKQQAISIVSAIRPLTTAVGLERAPLHLASVPGATVFQTIVAMDQQVTQAIDIQVLASPVSHVQQPSPVPPSQAQLSQAQPSQVQPSQAQPSQAQLLSQMQPSLATIVTCEVAQTSNALRVASVLGTTLALALCPGQVAGAAVAIAQNMALSVLIDKTGAATYAGKFAGVLSTAALGQVVDLGRPLADPKKVGTREYSSAQRAFFALVLGEQVFSEAEIARMSEADVRQALERAQAAPEWFRHRVSTAHSWRQTLKRFQATRLAVTRGSLVTSITTNMAVSATNMALADLTRTWATQQWYGDTIGDANESDLVTQAAGVSEAERNALRVASSDGTFQEQHMKAGAAVGTSSASAQMSIPGEGNVVTQEALSGLRKLDTYLAEHPLVAAELSLPRNTFQHAQSRLEDASQPFIIVGDPVTTVQTKAYSLAARTELVAVRAERHLLRVACEQAKLERQIGQVATRLQWSVETRTAIKTRADLQRAIHDVQLVQPQPGIGTRKTEMGSLQAKQLIPEEMMKRFNRVEFAPVYTTVRNAAIDAGTSGSWIPGIGLITSVTEGVNRQLDALDTTRNVWNLGVAVNELLGLNQTVKDYAGYLPTQELGRIPRMSQLLSHVLPEAQKIKAGDLLMGNLIRSVQHQWSRNELLQNIALDALGRDAASADYAALQAALSKFL